MASPRSPKPDTREIASSGDGRDVTRAYLGALAWPDDSVLRSRGFDWEAYREIRRDGQVHATFQQRRNAVVARELVVEPGGSDPLSGAAAEQLRLNLAGIGFKRALKAMCWGFFYGFSVAECMWSRREGGVWLDKVKVRTPWRFRFTPGGELRLLTRRSVTGGEALPPQKFWVMSSGADTDDEPYGLGLAHQLYWPVYFKKQGIAFWLRALEKFGGPTAVGKYPAGSTLEEQAKLLAAAQALRIDGAVVIPEGMSLELLEAMRSTVDQAAFMRQMNAAISKIIVGQTMTTDDGASLAQGEIHQEIREEITDADAVELCESFRQGPARWLAQWNFRGAKTPRLSLKSPDDRERASRLRLAKAETAQLMAQAGYEPTDEAMRRDYEGWRRRGPATLSGRPER